MGSAWKKSHITSVALTAWEVMSIHKLEPGQLWPCLSRAYSTTEAFSLQPSQVVTFTVGSGRVMLGVVWQPLRSAQDAAHSTMGGSILPSPAPSKGTTLSAVPWKARTASGR